MTNYEKYKEEIKKAIKDCTLGVFFNTHINGQDNLIADGFVQESLNVYDVIELFVWLNDEYKEPEIDWNKVAVDTPILVRNEQDEDWQKRYFAKLEYEKVCAWSDGKTSWTAKGKYDYCNWEYAKLAEGENQ